MPLESNIKLLTTIKDNGDIYEYKHKEKDEKFLKSKEKEFIKHLNRIKTLQAELNLLRRKLTIYSAQKKHTAKEIKENKYIIAHVAFLESEESFLNEEKDNTQSILRDASALIWEEYKREKDIPYNFEDIIRSEKNLRFFFNEGIISTYNLRFVPRVLSDYIKRIFPTNPKDEFKEARALKRHFIIHEGNTNSGKTYFSIKRLMEAKNGLYLAPLRLLALEIFDTLNANNVPCNLRTGEEEIEVKFASHTSSTVEKADLQREYEVVVIDEAQMLADKQRGAAWTKAILGIRSKEIHICCALYATKILKTIIKDCEDTIEIITHERDTDLVIEDGNFSFPNSVRDGDALIVFSRRSVLNIAAALEEKNIACSLIYGSLPPETRRMQFVKFLDRQNKVLVSTDAIGMGVNLPIKRIVFLENEKFDGVNVRPLHSSEIKQIAGRAGRKGIYDVGYINTLYNRSKDGYKEMLVNKESPIDKVYIAPTEDILKVAVADLEILLKVWADIDVDVDFYEKTNVDRLVSLINIIAQMGLKKYLSDSIIFKAINIPFDEDEKDLLYLWKDYLRDLSLNKKLIPKPYCDTNELYDLEVFYKKINLYYSFSKTFSFPIDEGWVREERTRVAKLIDKYLKEKIKKHGKTCKYCRNPLPWNSPYSICERCYGGYSNNSDYSDYRGDNSRNNDSRKNWRDYE